MTKKQELKLNSVYSNFELISRKKYPEIDSVLNILKHKELGIELFYFENENQKKTFQISFTTPSISNSGVQHILEHSVLRGSRKYDFGNKETFALLAQKSIVSYLNALTYPDKTVYPFSTNLESEFFKIMDIYLDAVFFPNVLKNENFFKQEGWRYDVNEKGEIFFNGVVFNEMKGAGASIERIRDDEISKIIFKDNQNSLSSGGDPNYIVNLKWEELVRYHKKYYHPTNSTIYLAGKFDIFKALEKIEKEFLVNFEKGKKSEEIKNQEKFNKVEKKIKITSSKEEKASDFSISFLINTIDNVDEQNALNFLMNFLAKSEESILKTRIEESKLVDNFGGYLEDDYKQAYIIFYFSGINLKDKEKIEGIFYSSLKEILKNGINKETLKSFLSSFEYRNSIRKYNHMLDMNLIQSIDKYIRYGFDYKHIFNIEDVVKKLRKTTEKDNKTLENYLKKNILENNSRVSLILEATQNLNTYEKLDKKLEKINKNKNSEEFKKIEKEIEKYKKYENSINEPKSKILPPEKSQIPDRVIENDFIKKIISEKENEEENKITYFYSYIPEKNIKKVNFVFDALFVSEEELQKYKLLVTLLPFFTTKNKTKVENEKEKNNIFGQFSINNTAGKNIKIGKIYSKFVIKAGYLVRNEEKVFKFLNNFLENIEFDKKTISEKITFLIKTLKDYVSENGLPYVFKRAQSKNNILGALDEKFSGISFIQFLEETKKDFEKKPENLIKDFKNIFQKIILKNNLKISVVSADKDFNLHKKLNLKFDSKIKENVYKEIFKKENEAIIIDSLANSFLVALLSVDDKEIKSFSKYNFLITVLNYGYLWKKIREDGGAYGVGFNVSKMSNSIGLFSYMDSRIAETYKDFEGISEYLQSKEFKEEITEEKMRGFFASTLGGFLEKTLATEVACRELDEELNATGSEYKNKVIKEILDFKEEDFKILGKELGKMFENYVKVAIGPKDKIKKDKKIFNKIWELK